jgi:hypothetical protein
MHYQVVLAVIVSALIVSSEESEENTHLKNVLPFGADEFAAYNNFYGLVDRSDDRSKKGILNWA